MGRLNGKVALISGGARGQGATEAKLFVREGAKVVFGDILDEEGQRVEAEIRAAGGEAIYVHLDVTNEDSWRAAVDTAVRLYGTLNILVNNAGIYIRKRIEETTEDDLDQIMAVKVKGVFLLRIDTLCHENLASQKVTRFFHLTFRQQNMPQMG